MAQDIDSAVGYFQRAAAVEDDEHADARELALVQLGTLYHSGMGSLQRDDSLAVACFSKCRGALGQHNLGYCVWQGLGTDKDLARAAALFKASAEGGHDPAYVAYCAVNDEMAEAAR